MKRFLIVRFSNANFYYITVKYIMPWTEHKCQGNYFIEAFRYFYSITELFIKIMIKNRMQ